MTRSVAALHPGNDFEYWRSDDVGAVSRLSVMSSEVYKKNCKTSKTIVLRKPPISVVQIVGKFLVVSGARHGASFLGRDVDNVNRTC